MDELLELIQFIRDNRLDDSSIANTGRKDAFYIKLYILLKTGKVKTDREAIQFLFNGKKNVNALWRAKKQLKMKLINILLTIDYTKNDYHDREKAYYEMIRTFSAAQILLIGKYLDLYYLLLNQILQISLKYDFTDFAVVIARDLYLHSINSHIDLKKNKNLARISNKYYEIMGYENLATFYYSDLNYLFYSSHSSSNKEFRDKLKKYSDELKSLQSKILTLDFNRMAFSIISSHYMFDNDFKVALQNAERAIIFLKEKPFESKLVNFTFKSDRLIALIFLRQHQLAEIYINQLFNEYKKTGFNYLRLVYYEFFNYSLWGKFDRLYEIVKKAFKDKNLISFRPQYEMWRIREAYVHFLIEAGVIPLMDEERKNLRKFRLNKFLNDVPIYSKEKGRKNISIIVVEMLFYILRRQYDQVIDRIDSLKQYSYKYLRNDETFRYNCFIKMLIKIPTANFHRERVIAHTRNLAVKLEGHEIGFSDFSDEIEVVPYVDLWKIILDVLDRNWTLDHGK